MRKCVLILLLLATQAQAVSAWWRFCGMVGKEAPPPGSPPFEEFLQNPVLTLLDGQQVTMLRHEDLGKIPANTPVYKFPATEPTTWTRNYEATPWAWSGYGIALPQNRKVAISPLVSPVESHPVPALKTIESGKRIYQSRFKLEVTAPNPELADHTAQVLDHLVQEFGSHLLMPEYFLDVNIELRPYELPSGEGGTSSLRLKIFAGQGRKSLSPHEIVVLTHELGHSIFWRYLPGVPKDLAFIDAFHESFAELLAASYFGRGDVTAVPHPGDYMLGQLVNFEKSWTNQQLNTMTNGMNMPWHVANVGSSSRIWQTYLAPAKSLSERARILDCVAKAYAKLIKEIKDENPRPSFRKAEGLQDRIFQAVQAEIESASKP